MIRLTCLENPRFCLFCYSRAYTAHASQQLVRPTQLSQKPAVCSHNLSGHLAFAVVYGLHSAHTPKLGLQSSSLVRESGRVNP
ncbi:hypothetical protein IEQ34_004052 [Dendrobium chrysotoxum]|uniref:Uncharacterized protein n=1 Tax=Dendrobium chrysotoxum TaxID=161865 RepID=A0AAV7GZ51_DENCH|nr:hypothetical protein IEQ34_004052 [Dendrobium chrysotoxum]